MKDLLRELIEAHGPSGQETEVRNIILKNIRPYVTNVYTDKFGNLIAHKNGKKPAIMLASHMDEIGIMIESIDEQGWIKFSPVGFIEPLTLLGERVKLKTRKGFIQGVITSREIADDDEFKELPDIKKLYVDTGHTKKELKSLGVEIGDYLFITISSFYMGNKKFIAGKALDDRLGCYILLQLAKMMKNSQADIYYVFTVQEEVGLYGAKTSVYKLEPDYAIIVDATNSEDYLGTSTKKLGHGPCITVKDAELITNRCLDDIFKDIAKKKKIPIQLEVTEKGTTDALTISISKGGIPCAIIAVATRNIHTSCGIASVNDINQTIKLLSIFLKKPMKNCI